MAFTTPQHMMVTPILSTIVSTTTTTLPHCLVILISQTTLAAICPSTTRTLPSSRPLCFRKMPATREVALLHPLHLALLRTAGVTVCRLFSVATATVEASAAGRVSVVAALGTDRAAAAVVAVAGAAEAAEETSVIHTTRQGRDGSPHRCGRQAPGSLFASGSGS